MEEKQSWLDHLGMENLPNIEETNQRATCQYVNSVYFPHITLARNWEKSMCGKPTQFRVHGTGIWLCEEHVYYYKIYQVNKVLDKGQQ